MEFVFDDNPSRTARRSARTSSGNGYSNSGWQNSDTILTTPARKSVQTSVTNVEFTEPPKRKRKTTNVKYLKGVKRKSRKKRSLSFEFSWNKVGWMIFAVVFMRLILMDRGVIHYYKMQNVLEDQVKEMESIKSENQHIKTEIQRIKSDAFYQRKVAREHLGVIAKDEYLILFAQEK